LQSQRFFPATGQRAYVHSTNFKAAGNASINCGWTCLLRSKVVTKKT